MKIAILCTSNDTSDFAKRFITDDVKYMNLLRPLRPDWDCRGFAVWQNEFPKEIADFDGVILTGSPASVNDSDPWIAKLLDLIRTMNAQKIPMFGACFGHQAIAAALGGRVENNRTGQWSVATEPTHFTNTPAYFDGVENDLEMYSIHKEEVTVLPKHARTIGSNEFCENAAFVIGDHVLTSQFHPEMTSDFLVELIDEMRGGVDDAILDAALPQFQAPSQGPAFAKAIVQFFEFAAHA